MTMVSWYPKQSKYVLLLSTLHLNDSISVSGKPQVAEFYLKAKTGVNALDQKVRCCTAYRKTY